MISVVRRQSLLAFLILSMAVSSVACTMQSAAQKRIPAHEAASEPEELASLWSLFRYYGVPLYLVAQRAVCHYHQSGHWPGSVEEAFFGWSYPELVKNAIVDDGVSVAVFAPVKQVVVDSREPGSFDIYLLVRSQPELDLVDDHWFWATMRPLEPPSYGFAVTNWQSRYEDSTSAERFDLAITFFLLVLSVSVDPGDTPNLGALVSTVPPEENDVALTASALKLWIPVEFDKADCQW